MTKTLHKATISKSKGQVIFENVLLAVCLCVLALRVTFTESPNAQFATQPVNLGDTLYSLSVSAVLIFAFLIWFVSNTLHRRFIYNFTGLELGLALFCIAALIAGIVAPNKRAAITDFVKLLGPLVMALLLVQILDSPTKIKLALVAIIALGVTSAYQCAYQLLIENQGWIYRYEHDPESMLGPLGIQPGSLNQMMLEHRIYSMDVKGFFTTGNSAGSFALLAGFAAIALFIEKFKNRKSAADSTKSLLILATVTALVFAGLLITHSKGAILASVITALLLAAYLLFPGWLKTHKTAILFVSLGAAVAVTAAVADYGIKHHRLPGGNSMLVRWQYWNASAKMYADHPITGVGPGNFSNFYPHYKNPAALEVVKDPHNFILRILTQYGPLGLLGFLAMILLPLWKIAFKTHPSPAASQHRTQSPLKKLALPYAIVVALALLVIRPVIMPPSFNVPGRPAASFDLLIYTVSALYIAPVVAFLVGLALVVASQNKQAASTQNITIAALFCAVLGFLIHNLIDFAIFEPGVFTTFCFILACLIALYRLHQPPSHLPLKLPSTVKILIVVGGLAACWAYFNYALTPVARVARKTKLAMQNIRYPQYAHQLLDQAANDDPLAPEPLAVNGSFYLHQYEQMPDKQTYLLKQAQKCFIKAIKRNPVDFKQYENLTHVYNLLAQASTGRDKHAWLDKAFHAAYKAVELYPGSARLRFELAKIAETLAKTDIAVENYKKTIEIEDAFRAQFRLMYPDQKTFSRLGQDRYDFARQRISQLSPISTP